MTDKPRDVLLDTFRKDAVEKLSEKYRVIEGGRNVPQDAGGDIDDKKANGNGHLGITKKHFFNTEIVRIMTCFADNATWSLDEKGFLYDDGWDDRRVIEEVKTERMEDDIDGWCEYLTYWRKSYVGRLPEEVVKPKISSRNPKDVARIVSLERELLALKTIVQKHIRDND